MAKRLTALERARKDSPPVDRHRKSKLERDDVHELLEEWMTERGKGDRPGESFAWLASSVLPLMEPAIKTTESNLRRYCKQLWPSLYEGAR